MTESNKEEIKKEIEKEIDSWHFDFGNVGAMYLSPSEIVPYPNEYMKSRILTLLSKQHQEWVERLKKEVEGLKMGYFLPKILKENKIDPRECLPETLGAFCFNQALDTILSLLSKDDNK